MKLDGLGITLPGVVKFAVLWIVVAFLVKLVVPADWRSKLFGIS